MRVFGLSPLLLQVGDAIDASNHDGETLGLLFAEDRLAGGFGVADAGELVVGRSFVLSQAMRTVIRGAKFDSVDHTRLLSMEVA